MNAFVAGAPRPMVVGHRGVPRLHQENTLYLRMFDVGWADGAPSVLGPLAIPDGAAAPPGVAVVPT